VTLSMTDDEICPFPGSTESIALYCNCIAGGKGWEGARGGGGGGGSWLASYIGTEVLRFQYKCLQLTTP
jgi:hypothetical protein